MGDQLLTHTCLLLGEMDTLEVDLRKVILLQSN